MSQAPPIITELVERFERNRDEYRKQGLNETQVRREYLDRFFEALGWDVANRQGHAPAYREVIHEDAVKVGGVEKAPDYSFRIGGARKFFVEAKNPAVNLHDDPRPAYQLRRYAWSAKLPLSILSDFEELAVYDCRIRPSASDKPSAGRSLYLTCRDYETRWDDIASVFSKDAVLKGSFDKYAVSERKRGTATVDKEFLAEIESWRAALARHLALRNRRLSVQDLNFAVQRTIDRIIFLRICEDRGVEHYGRLQALLNGGHTYARLRQLFDQADDRYNSGLFHFRPETGRAEIPDDLTPKLKIDDKVLKDIIERLYSPKSPYEFSVFPAEILGQVYEQFLGKVIRLTAGHQAKIEEKPEVKKAGGVYYTPAYIVDYIVKQTVGVLCKDKTPKQIAKLRILDPACGSGSFLIGAYTYLMTYHRDWYVKDGPEKHKKELFQTAGGEWRLTTQEKKRILLNNIYGVDIDSQAVEVTKLSLLLKVLEGESDETLRRQLSFIRERALPDLGSNIKCGNSLIGPDYFTGQLLPDEDEMRRVNPFDWQREFPDIFLSSSNESSSTRQPPSPALPLKGGGEGGGGFDAVIGNPPYVRIHNLVDFYPGEVRFIQNTYETAQFGKVDIYVAFIEKGLQILAKSGRLGFIVPNKFMQADYGIGLRKLLVRRQALVELVDFGDTQIFEGATTYTCLLFLSGSPQQVFLARFNRSQQAATRFLIEAPFEERRASAFGPAPWQSASSRETAILKKVEAAQARLSDVVLLAITGVKTGANSVFVFEMLERKGKTARLRLEDTDSEVELETDYLVPYLKAESLKRYHISAGSRVLLYPYQLVAIETRLTPERQLKKCVKTWRYLLEQKRMLEGRQKGKLKGPSWYGLSFSSSLQMFSTPKIVTPTLSPRNSFSLDIHGYLFPQGAGGGCGLVPNPEYSADYLLGLLNSRLLTFYFQRISSPFQGGWFAYEPRYLNRIPIHVVDKNKPADKASHDRLVHLVQSMLELHKWLAAAKNPNDQARLQSQIDATDSEIDRLVYDLYGLTEEEIKTVEACGEPGRTTSVASSGKLRENEGHDPDTGSADRPGSSGRSAQGLETDTRHSSEGGGGTPEGPPGAGEPVHGVREPTRQYGSPEDPASGSKSDDPVGSTRFFDTAEGRLSYSELSERLAVPLVAIYDEILQAPPDQIAITSEWLCLRHKRLAGHLFPDWAGRFRDVNVQVGAHEPPPFYEVPVHMRQFCDDLAERLRHDPGASVAGAAEFLAWADWRFQWIHPFRDFNGRIGRVLLAAMLYKLSLPHVETAPLEADTRRQYLEALHAADDGNLGPLTDIWTRRIVGTL